MADVYTLDLAATWIWGSATSWVGNVPNAADNAFITVAPLSLSLNTDGGDQAITDLTSLSKLRIGDSRTLTCTGDVLFGDGSELYDEDDGGSEGAGDGTQVLEIGDSFRIGEIQSAGAAGTVSSTPHRLTDGAATFQADSVSTDDWVFIYADGGGTGGSYAIASIDSETQLTLATAPGASSGDVHYEVRNEGTGDIENFQGWIKLTADLDNIAQCGAGMGSVLTWLKDIGDVRRWRHLWIAAGVQIVPHHCGAQTTNKGRFRMDAGSALLHSLAVDSLLLYPEWNVAEKPLNIAADATIRGLCIGFNLPSGGATEEIDLGAGGIYITSALAQFNRGIQLWIDSDDDATRAHTYIISGTVTVSAGRYQIVARKNTGGQTGHTVRLDGGFTAPVLAFENFHNDGSELTLELNSDVHLGELIQGATCIKTLALTLKLTSGTLTITETLDLLGTKLTGTVSGTGAKLELAPAGSTLTVHANGQTFGDVTARAGDIAFTAGDSMAVSGEFEATDAAIASTVDGSSAALVLSQEGVATGGSFKDIDCSGGHRITALNSEDLGGNTNIRFVNTVGQCYMECGARLDAAIRIN